MPDNSTERATLLILVPSASLGFALAFNLGAFGVVFFDQILTVWVIATIVLVASLVSAIPPNGWWGRIILLLPTFWLLLAFGGPSAAVGIVEDPVAVTAIIISAVCLPFIAWILIAAINPDFLELPNRNRVVVIAAVLAFVVVGWAFGYRNDTFLNCDDFTVSGNDLPQNCVQASDPG